MINKTSVKNLNKTLTALIFPAALVLLLLFPALGISQPYRTGPPEVVFSMSDYIGKKLLLFVYDIDSPNASFLADKVNELYKIRNEYNFDVAGICLNKDRAADADKFKLENNIAFKVVLDHNKTASQKLRTRGQIGLYIFNKKGKGIAGSL